MRMGPRHGIVLAASLLLLAPAPPAQAGRGEEEVGSRADSVLGLARSRRVRLTIEEDGPGLTLAHAAGDGWQDLFLLEPTDVRAPGYTLLVQREDGSFAHSPGTAPRTVRGRLVGRPGSLLAGTLEDDGLRGRMLLPGEGELWIEPAPGGEPGEHVLYEAADVDLPPRVCGALTLPGSEGEVVLTEAPSTASAGTLKVAELACDADYEYFLDHGGVAEVETRILSVINGLNLQYEAEVGITHVVTQVVVRTSSSQPYTSTDAATLLNQFRSEWNANRGSVPRDAAHLFTGKEINGGTIGIAWVGVVCNLSYAYGLSQSDFSTNWASTTDLTAHELGHNWNASHCSCTSYTMNPYITSANTFEPNLTIPTITAFRDSLGCLDDGSGTPEEPADPADRLAAADQATPLGGIVSGSYLSTHVQDGTSEVLQEATSAGKPDSRRSRLEHVWRFEIPAASSYTFFVDAHHTPNAEGDDFRLSFSTDGSTWTEMLVVTRTVDDDTVQSYVFPLDVEGTLFVKAEDTDDTPGHGTADRLYVDALVVRVDLDGVDTTPPAPPAGLAATAGDGSVALDWLDNGESDLAGYVVGRSTSAGGPYTPLSGSPQPASEWLDDGLANGTPLYYVVAAVDLAGNPSAMSAEVRSVPGSTGPTSCHVADILVGTESLGGGQKRGLAQVLVVDELGAPAAGVAVTGRFSGDLAELVTATTDGSGVAVLRTSGTARGGVSLTLCVENLVSAELTWAQADDVETCDVR